MPNHVYIPLRTPPTWRDRLYIHSMDLTVAGIAVMFGLTVGLSLILPDFVPSRSMDKMPWPITMLISFFMGFGGILAIVGLYWRGDDASEGWARERLGWVLAAAGFFTYAISVGWSYPGSLFSWGVPFALGVGSYIRVEAIKRIEREVRRAVPPKGENSE